MGPIQDQSDTNPQYSCVYGISDSTEIFVEAREVGILAKKLMFKQENKPFGLICHDSKISTDWYTGQ